MTFVGAALQGLSFYRRTYVAVACGVGAAVAVLAGAWLVGHSVRQSLADLVERRLGRTDVVVSAEVPFTEALAIRIGVPILTLSGIVEHQTSSRRAGQVQVYGIDDRFFTFHGVIAKAPRDADVLLSPDLAAELGAAAGDTVLVRVARPTDIPLDSLHGRKEDVGRTIRLRFHGVLPAESMGEFSLTPTQGPARIAFVPLARLQRDLGLAGRVTAALASGPDAADGRQLRESITADDIGITFAPVQNGAAAAIESSGGLVRDAVAAAATEAARAQGLPVTPVLTWLATKMTVSGRTIPYSLVTALSPDVPGDAELGRHLAAPATGDPPIVLNEWAARELQAAIGAPLELEFYRWADEGRLVTDRARFQVRGIVPLRGLPADPRLAPEYPGITESKRVSDWDPPFPIDLRMVRPQDEAYWEQHRTTPKAFIPLETGQRLWRTRHGSLTSIRIGPLATGADVNAVIDRVRSDTMQRLTPTAAGFTVVDVREQQMTASAGATDFGAYFSYFSFFLVVSALLIAGLFFRLSIEQRLPQIGVLRASGFSLPAVRRLFLSEGAVVVIAGSVLGVALAIGWAALMMYGLRTWWVGAVSTTRLRLSLDVVALASGALAAAVAAFLAIAVTVRGLSRSTPRQLLHGESGTPRTARGFGKIVAIVSLSLALVVSALSGAGLIAAAGGFFGAGTLALIGGLGVLAWRLRRTSADAPAAAIGRLLWLGRRNAGWKPGRSLTSAGLVAAAVFLLVSVDAFRKAPATAADRRSGTGGFSLIGDAALPIIHDPTSRDGQEALNLTTDDALSGVTVTPFRLRPGDDTSCLNLYQPKRPRVAGVPAAFVQANRFRFRHFAAGLTPPDGNGWQLLDTADAGGIVPAIVDQTSLQYVLHAAVGDVITIDTETARPVKLRIVASLDDSVLQGEILIAERAFTTLFPDAPGYRMLLVDIASPTPERTDAVTRSLEERLEPFGVDVQETARRLESFHRVENTYLSTFQALGGLGLLLGVIGLSAVIARNVLERRRELALLGATGFAPRHLRTVVATEQLSLLAAGLVIGVVAALVAIAPVIADRGGRLPMLSFVWIGLVAVAGVLSTLWATRQVRRTPLINALRAE